MKNKPLAILEGPETVKLRGWRNVMLITAGRRPEIVFSADGGRSAALQLGVRHYEAGTWEAADSPRGFPLPRPEILTEIYGTQQKELVI